MRVDAYAVGGATRHIESAYFTFIAPDEKGNPATLPCLRPANEVSVSGHFASHCIC